jgi:putative chitinase
MEPGKFTLEDLERLLGRSQAERWHSPLLEAFIRFGINTARRQAHFLAQVAHESQGFNAFEENLYYSPKGLLKIFPRYFTEDEAAVYAFQPTRIANRVYGGRLGNGPEASGDGWTYRGKGLIQLTGRANYRAAGKALGVDLEALPAAASEPRIAALVAAWFWSSRFTWDAARPIRGLNYWADRDALERITKAINGGLNGLADRQKWLVRAKTALGV